MPLDGWHPHDHPDHPRGPRHPRRRTTLAAASFLPAGGASVQAADAAQCESTHALFRSVLNERGLQAIGCAHPRRGAARV